MQRTRTARGSTAATPTTTPAIRMVGIPLAGEGAPTVGGEVGGVGGEMVGVLGEVGGEVMGEEDDVMDAECVG